MELAADSTSVGTDEGTREFVFQQFPGLEELWAVTKGSDQIRVGVLDGPVDLTHSCFRSAKVSCLSDVESCGWTDGEGSQHGTHVASLLFGSHASSVTGVCPNCTGVVIPVFREVAGKVVPASEGALAKGIRKAIDAQCNVINISAGTLGTRSQHASVLDAVQKCREMGIVIVASAGGNFCDDEIRLSPANAEWVIPVATSEATAGCRSEYSNSRLVFAPGHQLLGAIPGNQFRSDVNGSSFSAPLVTGVIALLLSKQLARNGSIDSESVRNAIIRHGRSGRLTKLQYGELRCLELGAIIRDFEKIGAPMHDTRGSSAILPDDTNPIEPKSSNALPSEDVTLQACCSSCEAGEDGNTTKPLLPVETTPVFGIGFLEAAFRSDSQIRYWKQNAVDAAGNQIPFDPDDKSTISNILQSDRWIPQGAVFVPPFLAWASELTWYLRVKLALKLVIQPQPCWCELKYDALAKLLNDPWALVLFKAKIQEIKRRIAEIDLGTASAEVRELSQTILDIDEDSNDVRNAAGDLASTIRLLGLSPFNIPPNFDKRFVLIGGVGVRGPQTILDPELEIFSHWTLFDLWLDAVLDYIIRTGLYPTQEQKSRLAWTLSTIFNEYVNEGTNDHDRAINYVALRSRDVILQKSFDDNGVWQISSIVAEPTQGDGEENVWQVHVTFTNIQSSQRAPIVIRAYVDLTSIKPTFIDVYQLYG